MIGAGRVLRTLVAADIGAQEVLVSVPLPPAFANGNYTAYPTVRGVSAGASPATFINNYYIENNVVVVSCTFAGSAGDVVEVGAFAITNT